MRIALDAMGGDHAPGEIVRGAVLAARRIMAPTASTSSSSGRKPSWNGSCKQPATTTLLSCPLRSFMRRT